MASPEILDQTLTEGRKLLSKVHRDPGLLDDANFTPHLLEVLEDCREVINAAPHLDDCIFSFFDDYDQIQPFATEIAHAEFQKALSAKTRNLSTAIFYAESALRADPNHVPCLLFTAQAYQDKNESDRVSLDDLILTDKAIDLLQRATEVDPENLRTKFLLVRALVRQRHGTRALGECRKLVTLCPENLEALLTYGLLLDSNGLGEEALKYFNRAISLYPLDFDALAQRSLCTAYKPTESEIQELESFIAEEGQASDVIKPLLHPAALLRDRSGHTEKAFHYLNQAYAQIDGVESFKGRREFAKSLRGLYPEGAFSQDTIRGSESRVPIFIAGMPRSGTTLLQRILAGHRDPQGRHDVYGAGELQLTLSSISMCWNPRSETSLPMSRENASRMAQFILKNSQELAWKEGELDPQHIVDKTPDNFFFLGPIHQLFPNATIIHIIRDPADTLFSMYFRNFNSPAFDFTCDLNLLGRYYREVYETQMQHWKKVLPQDRIIEVRYEDLVRNPEDTIGQLYEACGLEGGYESFDQGVVSGLFQSEAQATRTIYQTSIGRHKRYAQFLSPLYEALENGKI